MSEPTQASELLNMSNERLWLVCDVIDAARAWDAAGKSARSVDIGRAVRALHDAVRALDGAHE